MQKIDVLVEIPKGSRNKYEFDHERGVFKLDRMLHTSVQYPCDYGFIPDTLGLDGDPLDALVFLGEPTFPGCLIESRPLGMLRMRDKKGGDEKVLCVPISDPMWGHVKELSELPQQLLKEIEHFFTVYKQLEDKNVDVRGWANRAAAVKTIAAAEKRFKKMHTGCECHSE